MNYLRDEAFKTHILTKINPIVLSVLRNTTEMDKEDLKQELYLTIIETIHNKEIPTIPSFFKLCKEYNISID